jgi:hypothetical protein
VTVFTVSGDLSIPCGPGTITPFDPPPANTTWIGAGPGDLTFPGFIGGASVGVHPT